MILLKNPPGVVLLHPENHREGIRVSLLVKLGLFGQYLRCVAEEMNKQPHSSPRANTLKSPSHKMVLSGAI